MLLALTDDGLTRARRHVRGECPNCRARLIPKCGPIVTAHWAHEANDCDPWSEPETEWHRRWKLAGPHTEVVITRDGETHRADVITACGTIIELQSRFLDLRDIRARESFYGVRMIWLYRVTWRDRLHFGTRGGFWWKHGSKSMAGSVRDLYWDCGDVIWRVRLALVRDGSRIVGRQAIEINPLRFREWMATGAAMA